jgi:tetratricopeptide (TPR) repeat protein
MTVSGDLATIDLADLLQNIQVHSRTGTLNLVSEEGEAKVFFRDGNIAMLSSDRRAPLADQLVAAGLVSARKLEAAQKKQRGSRRCVAEVLVGARVLTAEELKTAAEDFLSEDVANLIASARGEFRFTENGEPSGFDPDETSLQLALPVAPLILEATRRVDHWVEIRKYLPTDSMHFIAREGARCRAEADDAEMAEQILGALDGSRSVREVADLFPNRRFLCYKLLADLVRDRTARAAGAEDLLQLALAAEADDPARARRLARCALDSEPHNLEALAVEARLCEQLGDPAASAEARKLAAHLQLEAGHTEEALSELEHAKRLTPADPNLWERTLAVAIAQGRREDALRDGLQLVGIYRVPGLHVRARDVLERLLRVEPDDPTLHVEYARCLVDCGQSHEAVKHLTRRGKTLIARQAYHPARAMYEEIVDIEPGNREAALSIEMIDKEIFAYRRERKRRMIRLCMTVCCVAVFGAAAGVEAVARRAFLETQSLISRERMIEQMQYVEAIALYRSMRERHPWSLTGLIDARRQIADLQDRLEETMGAASTGR